MVKNTKTSDPRFVDKTYIEAISSASNDTFLTYLIQTETISEGDREQIKNRAKNFINFTISSRKANFVNKYNKPPGEKLLVVDYIDEFPNQKIIEMLSSHEFYTK